MGTELKIAGTDASATVWRHDDGGSNGKTYGFTPTLAIGERSQFLLSLPFYQLDIEHTDKEVLTYGVDAKFKQKVTDNIAVGAHASCLQTYYGSDRTDEREGTVGVGPFVSFNLPLTQRFNLSFGGMVDYTNPEWSKDFVTGAVGTNLGIKLLDSLVLNPYVSTSVPSIGPRTMWTTTSMTWGWN